MGSSYFPFSSYSVDAEAVRGGGEGAGSGSGGNSGTGGGTIPGESSGKINLAWNSNTEPNIAGYKVYCRKDSEAYDSGVDVGLGSQQPNNSVDYTLSGLVKGQRYCISVTAYNKSNRESLFPRRYAVLPIKPCFGSVEKYPFNLTGKDGRFSESDNPMMRIALRVAPPFEGVKSMLRSPSVILIRKGTSQALFLSCHGIKV